MRAQARLICLHGSLFCEHTCDMPHAVHALAAVEQNQLRLWYRRTVFMIVISI